MKLTEGVNIIPSAAVLIVCFLIPGCFAEGNVPATSDAELADDITLTLGFERFPADNTCDGRDASPRIDVDGFSSASLALILEDPDAPSGTFYHWLIWNIPPVDVIDGGLAKMPPSMNHSLRFRGKTALGRLDMTGRARLPERRTAISSGHTASMKCSILLPARRLRT